MQFRLGRFQLLAELGVPIERQILHSIASTTIRHNRSVRPARSNKFDFPSAPSFNSITIRSPRTETFPIEWPGSDRPCAAALPITTRTLAGTILSAAKRVINLHSPVCFGTRRNTLAILYRGTNPDIVFQDCPRSRE